jgi:hypothetical protein
MKKQLDKVLQKRKQGGPFNGQRVELLKMDLENIASFIVRNKRSWRLPPKKENKIIGMISKTI